MYFGAVSDDHGEKFHQDIVTNQNGVFYALLLKFVVQCNRFISMYYKVVF